MRSSPITSRLRSALALFPVTEDEFRAIYQVQQAYSSRLELTESIVALPIAERNAFLEQRTTVQKELDAAMKTLLGDQRYAEFVRASDREYQQLNKLAERENLPTQAAVQAYDLRSQLSQESNRILNDASLAYDQKLAAFRLLAQNTRSQLIATLGSTAGEAYVKNANWLTQVERGASVTFSPTGGTSIRGLPNPNAPGRQIGDVNAGGTITISGGATGSGVIQLGSGVIQMIQAPLPAAPASAPAR
jgi:hypothetical protein